LHLRNNGIESIDDVRAGGKLNTDKIKKTNTNADVSAQQSERDNKKFTLSAAKNDNETKSKKKKCC
jgi:hypothetical protein